MIRLLICHGAEVNPKQGRRIYNKLGEDFYHELGFKDNDLGVADQDEVWGSEVSDSEVPDSEVSDCGLSDKAKKPS